MDDAGKDRTTIYLAFAADENIRTNIQLISERLISYFEAVETATENVYVSVNESLTAPELNKSISQKGVNFELMFFAGHGTPEGLQMEDRQIYDAHLLAKILAETLHIKPKLLFLCACQTDGLAKLLLKGGFPVVIASNMRTDVLNAADFCERFFQKTINSGYTIGEAFKQAGQELEAENSGIRTKLVPSGQSDTTEYDFGLFYQNEAALQAVLLPRRLTGSLLFYAARKLLAMLDQTDLGRINSAPTTEQPSTVTDPAAVRKAIQETAELIQKGGATEQQVAAIQAVWEVPALLDLSGRSAIVKEIINLVPEPNQTQETTAVVEHLNGLLYDRALLRSLNIGQSTSLEIPAIEKYSPTALLVLPGEKYRFVVDPQRGRWQDSFWPTDANGFFNILAWIGRLPLRVPQARCFELCGAFNRLDSSAFKIGKQAEIKMPEGGELRFFANDAEDYYDNNKKSIWLNVTRLS